MKKKFKIVALLTKRTGSVIRSLTEDELRFDTFGEIADAEEKLVELIMANKDRQYAVITVYEKYVSQT